MPPMMSRMTEARAQRTSPRALGEKHWVAILVIGKADDHKNTVIKANIADFKAGFMVSFMVGFMVVFIGAS